MVCSVLCVHHLLSVSSVESRSVEEGGGELTTLCGVDTTSADVN